MEDGLERREAAEEGGGQPFSDEAARDKPYRFRTLQTFGAAGSSSPESSQGSSEYDSTGTSGWWTRGEARVCDLDERSARNLELPALSIQERVRVVSFQVKERYALAEESRLAAVILRSLGNRPTDDAIEQFTSRFGPLFNYWEWARRVRAGWARFGSDARSFYDWCEEYREDAALAYLQSIWDAPDYWEAKPIILPEPKAVYGWAAHHLTKLTEELKVGVLSPEMRVWQATRLDELRLAPGTQPGTLVLRATTLLGCLASQVAFDAAGWRGGEQQIRSCLGCGEIFLVSHGNQEYCSPRCQASSKKRNQRAKKRNQAK